MVLCMDNAGPWQAQLCTGKYVHEVKESFLKRPPDAIVAFL